MDEILKALGSALRCQCSDAGVGGKQTRIYGILNVKVLNGSELNIENPYVILKLVTTTDTSIHTTMKTAICYQKGDPCWNEEFTLYVEDPDHQLLQIWLHNSSSMYDQGGIHEQVGARNWQFRNLTSKSARTQEVRFHKVKDGYEDEGDVQGKIMVKMMYTACPYYTAFEDVCPHQKAPTGTPQDGGLLVVIIHEARTLYSNHHRNPYVSLLFQGELRKTVAIKNTRNPKWHEEFTFILEQPPTKENMHFEVISTPGKGIIFRKEESMGCIDINAIDVVKERRITKCYELQNTLRGCWLTVELQWRSSN
uniref:synaptotagmin-1-like n=1 Tax=Erigeron canadensis TaxID=72917 RepID=UPI001CB92393|nr:synaptotagmin-1-like [Erigeron canadensis]